MIKNILVAFLSLFILIGCEDPLNKLQADELLYVSEDNYEKGYYGYSIKALENFEWRFPEHEKIPDAIYKRALAHYRYGNYSIAAAVFEKFLDKYPSHPKNLQAKQYLADCDKLANKIKLDQHAANNNANALQQAVFMHSLLQPRQEKIIIKESRPSSLIILR